MNEENNNPWENTNNNGMTDNTIYVQPSQTDDAAGAQNTAGTDAGPQPMPSSDNMYRFQNTNPGGGQAAATDDWSGRCSAGKEK